MTYWLHGAIPLPELSGLLEKLIVSQVVKIFLLSLFGRRMLCAVATTARHLSLALTRQIHSTLVVAIHFKIILLYTRVCYKWSFSFRVSVPAICVHLFSVLAFHMPCPSYPPLLYYSIFWKRNWYAKILGFNMYIKGKVFLLQARFGPEGG